MIQQEIFVFFKLYCYFENVEMPLDLHLWNPYPTVIIDKYIVCILTYFVNDVYYFSDLWYFPPSWWNMLELWHREIWRWWKWTFLSNSSLEIEGAEKSYFQWFIYKAVIRCIGDIKDQNGDFFLSCIDIILKYMVRCNFIDFHVIIRAMPTAWKTKPRV